jgi:predicted TIM-barrel fold metal-dependent hydrolase
MMTSPGSRVMIREAALTRSRTPVTMSDVEDFCLVTPLTVGNPSEYLRRNLYITTSGVCSAPPLLCALLALGADHILFGTDYPFETMADATRFLATAPVSEADRAKIAHQNAESLLKIG